MALNMIWLRWNNMLLNMNRCVLFEYGLIYDSLPSLRSPILIGIIIKRSETEYEPDGNKTVCGKI